MIKSNNQCKNNQQEEQPLLNLKKKVAIAVENINTKLVVNSFPQIKKIISNCLFHCIISVSQNKQFNLGVFLRNVQSLLQWYQNQTNIIHNTLFISHAFDYFSSPAFQVHYHHKIITTVNCFCQFKTHNEFIQKIISELQLPEWSTAIINDIFTFIDNICENDGISVYFFIHSKLLKIACENALTK